MGFRKLIVTAKVVWAGVGESPGENDAENNDGIWLFTSLVHLHVDFTHVKSVT
ncbi:hypothetical protein ACOMICROBIO_GDFFDHBD_04096 (plasmid) [Vibrio sp. B1REV9]|nr:hypothetical protein ACOMICROBIO_GDFFDHBD_04096 [Vibrio sp. B1REV9]